MKLPLLIPLLATALFATSCRTVTPVDPMTMKQSERCLPENFTPATVHATGTICGTK